VSQQIFDPAGVFDLDGPVNHRSVVAALRAARQQREIDPECHCKHDETAAIQVRSE